ncbi:unnamed protein product [Allacma fusca]|uniref:Uncharacterized protein n=1 Tax=Allacma fusca TaxID=39272 RepID=A0A8J2NKR4_9HEXA|nr:unnamed protein product [Allacma fusca]
MESVFRFFKPTDPTEGQSDTESPPVTQPAHQDEARVIYPKKEKRVEMPSLVLPQSINFISGSSPVKNLPGSSFGYNILFRITGPLSALQLLLQ